MEREDEFPHEQEADVKQGVDAKTERLKWSTPGVRAITIAKDTKLINSGPTDGTFGLLP